MGPVKRKTNITIDIEVKYKSGEKGGHIMLTSGNLYYYRANAKQETARYTYLQLMELIEKDLEEG